MATPYHTASPLLTCPAAADGVTVTPSGVADTNSTWVELTAAAVTDWVVAAIVAYPGSRVTGNYYEVDLGVGGAGAEVVVATERGYVGTNSGGASDMGNALICAIPAAIVSAGQRVACRLRQASTDTTTWRVSVQYFAAPVDGTVQIASSGPVAHPSGSRLSVTTGAGAWANSSWVEVSAATSTPWLVAAVVARGAQANWELDVGVGGSGAEVVWGTVRSDAWWFLGAAWEGGPWRVLLRPTLGPIPAGSRVAVRMRKSTTGAVAYGVGLTVYTADVAGASSVLPRKAAPAAADARQVSSAGSLAYGSWVELLATTTDEIAIVGLVSSRDNLGESRYQLGIGSAGAEVVIGTLVAQHGVGFGGGRFNLDLPIARVVPPGSRVSVRLASTGSGSHWCALAYVEGASQDWDNHSQALTQETTNAVTLTAGASWANGAWVQVSAATAAIWAVGAYMFSPAAAGEIEVDLGVGGAGLEQVVTTIRLASGNGISGSSFACEILPVPTLIPAGSRVAVRGRQSTGSPQFFTLSLQYTGEPGDDDLDFDDLDQQSGEVIGLTWVEFYHADTSGAAKTYLWAPVDLPDPSTYYGGYKEPRLLGMGDINRGLSDRMGQYESAEWSFIVSDTDRLLRGFFDRPATKHVLNRMVLARMIDDASRRTQARPRLLVRGLVRHYQPKGPLHFEVIARDHVASKFGPANLEKQIPQRLITRADFPNAPAEVIGLPVPILYGALGNTASATEPPVPVITPSLGAFLDAHRNPAGIMCGYAASTSAAAVPASVTVGLAAGGTLPTTVQNGEYAVLVTAVDSNGIESDPQVFYYDGPTIGRGSFSTAGSPLSPSYVETPDGTQKIQVSWAASAGAVSYRAYLAYYYYRAIFTQRLEVTAPTTSCEFTTGPDSEEPSTDNITPGATVPTFAVPWLYAVSAVMADGDTALSKTFFNICVPYRRGNTIEWTAVPGALAYRVYRKHPDRAAWSQVRTVAAGTTSYSDDLLNTGWTAIEGAPKPSGLVPTTYVGLMTPPAGGNPQHAFLVAGHAVKSIGEVYLGETKVADANLGATWFVPGKTGYSTYWPNTGTTHYYDINGHRYTLIFVVGNDGAAAATGDQAITVNVQGIESVGDSSGTLLTSITDIYQHAVTNWLFQSYASGAWLSAPTWPTDVDGTVTSQIDETSFDTVADIHAARVAGGYPGALMFGALGESITLREALARLNLSADCQAGFNRNSQFFVTAFDHRASVATGARAYTQTHDIVADTFQLEARTDEVENVVVYSYAKTYTTTARAQPWGVDAAELRDEDAIADLQEERRSPLIELHGIRSSAVAQDIAQRRLALYRDPPQWVSMTTNLKGLGSELGDTITVTHLGGTSASGWTGRRLRVMRHVTSPSQYLVRLECVDVDRLYAESAHALPAGALSVSDGLDASGWWARETTTGEDEITRPL